MITSKLKIYLLAGLLTCGLDALSQRPEGYGGGQEGPPMGNISGKLTDESGSQPLEFATIAVHSQQDSSLIGGGITDAKGAFSIDVKPGKYYVKAQFIGYGEKIISDVVVNRENFRPNLGNISLSSSELQLEEVTVQAERTQMELTLDKKVYNIGKDLSNLGGSAADLLANLPSMDVDVEGNVSLRGSENVQILIDGKPSGLIGLSGSGGLQQLQGNLIERVEVITNPSARYDAQGGAGIINIILKKDRAKGFNGSFQVQAGYPANNGASVNVNYRTGWINWFVNYGITYRESPGQGFTNNAYFRSDSTYFINQDNERNRTGLSNNVRFGSDIYFNEKNILTLSASYRNSDDDNTTSTYYDYLDSGNELFGERLRVDNEIEEDLNWQYEVEFTREFAKKDQKLTFDLQYVESNEVEISAFDDVTDIFGDPLDDLIQRSENDNGEKRTLVQLDYIHPYSRSGKLEVGMRYQFRNIFNDFIVESDSMASGNYEEVSTLTNDFNFDEGVLAGYFMVSNKFNKISWQLGTRVEQTNLETLLEQTQERNDQNYLSFFPSANFTYARNEITSVQLSYSRRISRPSFRTLNPFVTYSDPLNIYRGNPEVAPQFTDSYEIGILQNRKKSSIYYGIYHRHTEDVVQRIQREEEGITTRAPENVGIRNDIGIEVNITQEFSKSFRTTGNFNFYNAKTEGEEFTAEATTASFRINTFYRNDKLFNAQLSAYYRAPQNTAQGRSFAIGNVDLGFSKDVLKKDGTIALNIRDLFNTRKYRGETITDTFTTNSEFQWRRGPTVVASFTYRLNQSKRQSKRGQGRPEGGGFDEFGGDF